MKRKDYFCCYTKEMLNSENISSGGSVIAAEKEGYYVYPYYNTIYTGEEAVDRGVMPSLLTLIRSHKHVCVVTEGDVYKKAIPYLKTDKIKVIDFSKPNTSDGFNPLHAMKAIVTADPKNGFEKLSVIINKQAELLFGNALEHYTCFNLYKGLAMMFVAEVKEEELSFHSMLNCLEKERFCPGYISKISKYCKSGNYYDYFKYYLFEDDKIQYETLCDLIKILQCLCDNTLLTGKTDFEWDVIFLVTDEPHNMIFNFILSSYTDYLLYKKESSYIVTDSERFLSQFEIIKNLLNTTLIAGRTKEQPIENYLDTVIRMDSNKEKWNNALVNITILMNEEGQFQPCDYSFPVHLDLYSEMFTVVADDYPTIVNDYQIKIFDIEKFTDNLAELAELDVKRNYVNYVIDPDTDVEITDKNEVYDIYIVYIYGLNQYDYSLKSIFSIPLAKKEYIDGALIPWKMTFTGHNRKDYALQSVEIIKNLSGKAFIQGCNDMRDDYFVS